MDKFAQCNLICIAENQPIEFLLNPHNERQLQASLVVVEGVCLVDGLGQFFHSFNFRTVLTFFFTFFSQMLKVRNVHPPTYFDFTQALQEFLIMLRQMGYFFAGVFFVSVALQEFLLAVARPWKLAGDEVEEQDAKSKGVGFEGVYFFLKRFWWHIERASYHVHLLHLGFATLEIACEPQIPDFPHIALEEDVGGLDISMGDEAAGEIAEPIDKLMRYLPPVDGGIALNVVLKSAPLTELGHDVAVILCVVDIVEFNDVWIVQLLQDLDFIPEQLSLGLVEIQKANHFYRKHLFCSVAVKSPEHLAAEPTPNAIRHLVRVWSNSLAPH